jgi:hypothetical protein
MADHARWVWDEDEQRMKSLITRIHTIPAEDSNTLIHCAQLTCWCSPLIDNEEQTIVNHKSACPHPAGWFLVGELEETCDAQ